MYENTKYLISCAIDKDPKAQKALYDRYAPMLFAVCLRYTRCSEDAQDVLQEGFVKLFSSLDKYSFKGSFDGWLKRFFVNMCFNVYRAKRNQRHAELCEEMIETEEKDDCKDFTLERFTDEDLVGAMNSLTDRERIMFNMMRVEGYDVSEVSELFGVRPVTVLTTNSRTKRKLQKYLLDLKK